jgi:citrate lyase beta subunit
MDDHKWSKIPTIPADVLYVDLEDSVPVEAKESARERVIAAVQDPEFFGGSEIVCRPNNLATPWGIADVEALAAARVPFIVYPKARSRAEIDELDARMKAGGASPEIMILVETPQAVLHLEEIAAGPGVTSIEFGPFDLSVELGARLFDGEEPFREAFTYARSRCVLVGRALGLEVIEAIAVKDLRNLEAVQRAAMTSRGMGFTGMVSFYPSHVPVINEVMSPSTEEVDWAQTVLSAYAAATAQGHGATSVDGRPVTLVDVRAAERILAAV